MITQKSFRDVITFMSDPKHVLDVEIFLEKINKKLNLGEAQFNKLLVATTEAVNNSIIHGNQRDPEKKVTLTCELTDRTLIVVVQDEGSGVDPNTLPDPLAAENLLRENGRGVFLMRSLMDEIKFERFQNGAAVIMIMKLK
ncbi:MAG: ATP-binding protein [Ignavibacteriales bacterium]|nr:ATP-binding protein [Ignavibacteriales bacterium]